MARVFLYELRRQVINKFFVGLLAVCLFVSWMTLNTSVIQGIANTAPFSPWSFGYYMAQILPLLMVALLFTLWNVFSPTVRRLEVLTDATAVDQRTYTALKCGAALVSWLIILICTILLGLAFLVGLFGNAVSVGTLLLPCVVTVLPAMLFFFGAGLLAGGLKTWQSVAVIGLAVVASLLPFEGGLFGGGFYGQYPFTLGVLDPPFSMPGMLIVVKALFAVAGMLLIMLALGRKRNSLKD